MGQWMDEIDWLPKPKIKTYTFKRISYWLSTYIILLITFTLRVCFGTVCQLLFTVHVFIPFHATIYLIFLYGLVLFVATPKWVVNAVWLYCTAFIEVLYIAFIKLSSKCQKRGMNWKFKIFQKVRLTVQIFQNNFIIFLHPFLTLRIPLMI